MFKKNTAVTGFWIGNFISTTDGSTVTTGTPTCKRTLDGTAGACANAAAYDATGLGWKIDLAAGDLNGDMVGLSFTLAGCLPISYTLRTTTKLVSDLVDAAAAPSAADNADAVADELLSGHLTPGSLAVAITDIISGLAAVPTAAEIDTQLSGTHGAGAWGAAVVGASSVVYTVSVGGSPLAGVYVRMTSDAAGATNVDAGTTTALGQVTLHHDLASGTTVYLWRSLAGYEFADPDVEVIP